MIKVRLVKQDISCFKINKDESNNGELIRMTIHKGSVFSYHDNDDITQLKDITKYRFKGYFLGEKILIPYLCLIKSTEEVLLDVFDSIIDEKTFLKMHQRFSDCGIVERSNDSISFITENYSISISYDSIDNVYIVILTDSKNILDLQFHDNIKDLINIEKFINDFQILSKKKVIRC